MEENTQVKKEDAEILENEQKGGKKKWMKYAKIGFLLLVAVFLVVLVIVLLVLVVLLILVILLVLVIVIVKLIVVFLVILIVIHFSHPAFVLYCLRKGQILCKRMKKLWICQRNFWKK